MLTQLFLVFTLMIITYQDFKERQISTWTIPALFFSALYFAFFSLGWTWWFLMFNFVFVFIQIIGVTTYFSIKNKAFTNITNYYLGTGDLLFFIAICPLFSPLQFCFFFIGSLCLILASVFCYQVVFPKLKTIPLAGAMSLCTVAYILAFYYYNLSTYNDWPLVNFIYG